MFNSIKCHNFTYLNIDVRYDIAEILLGHVKLIIWFSDTDFQKNNERGGYLIFVFICILVQSLGCTNSLQ